MGKHVQLEVYKRNKKVYLKINVKLPFLLKPAYQFFSKRSTIWLDIIAGCNSRLTVIHKVELHKSTKSWELRYLQCFLLERTL